MYPVTAVEGAVGERLVVLALTSVKFELAKYANKLSNVTTFEWTFDWGDGDITSGVYAPATPDTTHKWTSPGEYEVQLQTVIGGALQSFSWRVSVVWDRTHTTGAQATPWVAVAHTSLRDDNNRFRHLVCLRPGNSNPIETTDGSALEVGQWGTPTAVAFDDSNSSVRIALDDALLRLQAAFAYSLGRLPFPQDRIDAAVSLAFPLDQICMGTNDGFRQFVALLEMNWRQAAIDFAQGLDWPSLASLTQLIALNAMTLDTLDTMPWAVAAFAGAGDRSVRMAEVMRWNEYALRELDDNQTAANVPVWSWRRQVQQRLEPLPRAHWETVWLWEAAQVASQVGSLLLDRLGSVGAPASATIALFANPETRQVTLRVQGDPAYLPFWAVLQVGPTASPDVAITAQQMASDADLRGGDHVAGRAVLVCNTAPAPEPPSTRAMPPYTWDVGRALAAFDSNAVQGQPVFDDVVAEQVRLSTQQVGQAITTALMQDGAVRRTFAAAGDNYLVDIVRPAMPLPDPLKMRTGIRPHALMNLLGAAGRHVGGSAVSLGGLNAAMRPR
ncbi:MAG: PKD domain-containing protein [Deltaproteobacteria bacterium]|nr:PKD domain-containing protein [Deltaproteobacteria bacterium]